MSEPFPYWRSLDERAGNSGVPAALAPGPPDPDDGATRRQFLEMLWAAAGGIGLAGCFTNTPRAAVPYARQPADVVPGIPLHYATTLQRGGFGVGVLVTAREGRPIKIEGNPDHPASLGATGVFEQGAIYQLYDPQRARTCKHQGAPATLARFRAECNRSLAAMKEGDGGARLRFLVEPSASPLLRSLRRRIHASLPGARFHAWDPLPRDATYEGTRLAFGLPCETRLDLDRARVIVSLDGDLFSGPFGLRYQRQFADHRVPANGLNRLYAAECGYSLVGAAADHRLRVRSSEILPLSIALLAALAPERAPNASGNPFVGHPWLEAAAADLREAGRAALVIAGFRQPPLVHAVACALNGLLQSRAVAYSEPVLEDLSAGTGSLTELADEIRGGGVETLVITAYNPVYTAPADFEFERLLARVPHTVYLGLFQDETSGHVDWFLPAAHALESWGDARTVDGTISFVQPLIEPRWAGVTAADVWASYAGLGEVGSHDLLRDFWREARTSSEFDPWWDRRLQQGVVEASRLPEVDVAPAWDAITRALTAVAPGPTAGLELNFVADERLLDGRFADNAWLQELPDPITKLTWSNAALIGPATSARLGLANEDRVEVRCDGRALVAPVLIAPGHAEEAVTLALGHGRSGAEVIARGIGVNANQLRSSTNPWFVPGVVLVKVPGRARLSITQEHWTMDGRPVALEVGALDAAHHRLPVIASQQGPQPSLYPPVAYPGYRWAMSIDMSRCTGCSACIVACEAENNILVVGADEVRRGREMQWLRVDRYFTGEADNPRVVMQPLACVHCEDAPCEVVCPVNATVHSDEGLNEMVYNRCVGTRYCSNNCPYKVRRFNFLNYHRNLPGTEEMAMNPDVTVRARGVMEKCSYCVQRIESVRIRSRVQGRTISDGEIVTACAQACPSQAIVFGSLHDPSTRVSQLREDPRSYQLLHELGTRPRTSHLARVRNPNPSLG